MRRPRPGWCPTASRVLLLNAALEFVEAAPYKVSLRWTFYRLLQSGWLNSKSDYNIIKNNSSWARMSSWGGWKPDTLSDDTRSVDEKGYGFTDIQEWLRWIPERFFSYVDRWEKQPNFVVVGFEAAAMSGQFDEYLPEFVTRVACKGDPSTPFKWDLAELIAQGCQFGDKPATLLYFGDDDEKGYQIPLTMVDDIRECFGVDFEYVRAGLNPGDGARYGIPENPERHGTYQWEALDDNAARKIIGEALESLLDLDAAAECADIDQEREERLKDWWENNGPTAADLES